jgi:hypothetical protein
MLLILVDAEVALQQISQTTAPISQNSRGPHGVEKIVQHPAILALDQDQVVLGRMEDLLHRAIGDDFAQASQVKTGQRIDDVILTGDRDLDQADALAVCVQTIGFQIDGYSWLPLQLGQAFSPGGAVLDECERGQRHLIP